MSAPWTSTSVRWCFFQLSHNRFFRRIWILRGLSHPIWDFPSRRIGLMRSLRLFFFLSAMMRRKSKILIPPLSLSHVQASICVSSSNVIIPFCSGCYHGVVPQPLAWRLSYSNLTAQLTPQSAASKSSNICNLETQQTARLSGSNGLKMFAFMTHIAVTVRLGGKYLHEWAALRWNPKKHELAAACLK